MDKLQHVQNAAARLVTGTGKYERGLSRLMHCMTTCTGWLFLSECSTSLLSQSVVVFATELHGGTSLKTVC